MGRPKGIENINYVWSKTKGFNSMEDLEDKSLVEGSVYSVYAKIGKNKYITKDKNGFAIIGVFKLIKKYKHYLLMEEVNCGYKECFKNCTANHRFKEV